MRITHLPLIAAWIAAELFSSSAPAQERTRDAALLQGGRVGDQLIINYFESDPVLFEPHLVITDVEGSGPVVNVLAYDTAGTLMFEESFHLPIFGKVNYNPVEHFGNRKFVGSIRMYADGGNIGAQYWKFYRKRDKLWGELNTSLPGSPAEGGYALLCQHFVSDPRIDAKLVLVNPGSDSSVTVAVTFRKDSGKQLSSQKHSIKPNGTLLISPLKENEGIITTGVVYCEVLRGGPITGEYWQAASDDLERYQVSLPLEIIPREKEIR